jgi:hypothetical protein
VERFHLGIDRDRLEQLHCWTGSAGDWERMRKQLQRADARFLKVSTGAGRAAITVLTTRPLPGSEAVSASVAVARLVDALRAVPLTSGRPVTCSKGWLPTGPHTSKWSYAGDIPASAQHFDAALQAEIDGGRLQGKVLEPKVAAAWRFPDGVPEEERDRIRRRMFGHTLPADRATTEEQEPGAGQRAG